MSEQQQVPHALFKIAIQRLDGAAQITMIAIPVGATHFPINIKFKHVTTGEILDATLTGVSKRTEVPVFQEYIKEEAA